MVIANTNARIAPYWGTEPSIAFGLNQLGLRNVAEQMFTTLLPGLNNVSQRIRYYSFYCWIIRQFYEGKETVVDKDFNPFIRRAELLLALINATLDDRSGIPGITFAATEVDKGLTEFSVAEGADISSGVKTYWSNPGGVFRAYYVASLVEMGLIGQNEDYPEIYNITKEDTYVSGLKLAEDFANSIGWQGALFLEIIRRGSVTIDELTRLNQAFDMKLMRAESDERAILRQMILQPDFPAAEVGESSHRRNTIAYILEYLATSPKALTAAGFSKYMYDNYHIGNDLTSWGWYAYYLDDNLQYQLTRIFHDLLAELNRQEWTPVDEVTDEMASKIIAAFGIDSSVKMVDFINSIDEMRADNSSADAVRNLLAYYRDNIDKCDDSISRYHEIGIRTENFCDFMKGVASALDISVYDFCRKTVEDVIYRHYRVSLRKMLQTNIATQKFALENGRLRLIDGWDATHTSPRIDTIRNFLRDLCIIEEKDGADIIKEHGNGDHTP